MCTHTHIYMHTSSYEINRSHMIQGIRKRRTLNSGFLELNLYIRL